MISFQWGSPLVEGYTDKYVAFPRLLSSCWHLCCLVTLTVFFFEGVACYLFYGWARECVTCFGFEQIWVWILALLFITVWCWATHLIFWVLVWLSAKYVPHKYWWELKDMHVKLLQDRRHTRDVLFSLFFLPLPLCWCCLYCFIFSF